MFRFNKIQHKLLRDALQVLRVDVELPSRYDLSNNLLDKEYASSVSHIEKTFTGQYCCLSTDGWTDVNGSSVMNYIAIGQNKSFFLESEYTGASSHTAEFLASCIERVMNAYPFIKFSGVVTDNTNTNKATWLLLQQKHPRLFLIVVYVMAYIY